MARLSARDRKEIWRVERESDTPTSDLTVSEKDTLALMTDRRVLRKRTVRFKPDSFYPEGRLHNYGWKEYKRLKETADPVKILEHFVKSGYRVVGTPDLSQVDLLFIKAIASIS